jgi:hypothetical protein
VRRQFFSGGKPLLGGTIVEGPFIPDGEWQTVNVTHWFTTPEKVRQQSARQFAQGYGEIIKKLK